MSIQCFRKNYKTRKRFRRVKGKFSTDQSYFKNGKWGSSLNIQYFAYIAQLFLARNLSFGPPDSLTHRGVMDFTKQLVSI